MPKIILLLIIFLLGSKGSELLAQNQNSVPQDSAEVTLQKVNVSQEKLPYNNPMISEEEKTVVRQDLPSQPLDSFQKDVMSRISGIYQMHVDAIEAQLNNDPLRAETSIVHSLTSLQALMEEYPEVQSSRRFNALYSTVMAEYQEFYGIESQQSQVKGEIFEIREEISESDEELSDENYTLPENITTRSTEVPLVQNRQVSRHLVYYTLKRPEVMEQWLERADKYFPMMEKIFEEEGAPKELAHLAMIESGLNPKARSWASAVGMWQFIRATGSVYGLEVNWWLDERRDPEKATRAAARHLKDLHDIWGDWHLALANYNISPSGLRRAINAAGGAEDYWEAYSYLPRETRGYVPGFIATTMIKMNPEEFGFKSSYDAEPYDYEVVEVEPLMALDKLAEAAGISTKELKEYNPELLQWATPPGSKYPLKLPVEREEEFLANYEDIPKEERSENITMHTVQGGETLGYIAQKYGTSVRGLHESNEDLSSTIHPGQKIVVPLAPGSMEKIAADRPTNQPRSNSNENRAQQQASAPPNTAQITYKVQQGDTIGHIAEWFDVRASQIRAWNGGSDFIREGDSVTIYVPENKRPYYEQVVDMPFTKKQEIEQQQQSGVDVTTAYLSEVRGTGNEEYQVQANDTLSQIANSFGVSIEQIREANNLNGNQIYVGQTLTINPSN